MFLISARTLKNGSPFYILISLVVFLIMVRIRICLLSREAFARVIHYRLISSYTVAVEILAIAIRKNNNIRGISIGDQEYKLVQYADDTSGSLKDEESLNVFLDVLKSYENVSGLKIIIFRNLSVCG